MMRSGLTAAVVLLSLWTAAAPAADKQARPAESAGDHELAHQLYEQGTIVSLESVVTRAQTIHPGELLEVELRKKRAGYVYAVEILDADGQVWDLKFGARDGQLIKEEKEKD